MRFVAVQHRSLFRPSSQKENERNVLHAQEMIASRKHESSGDVRTARLACVSIGALKLNYVD